jgi:transposase
MIKFIDETDVKAKKLMKIPGIGLIHAATISAII